MTQSPDPDTAAPSQKRYETLAFLFISVALFPILSIIFVGGFGFVIWMLQLVFGPPGS